MPEQSAAARCCYRSIIVLDFAKRVTYRRCPIHGETEHVYQPPRQPQGGHWFMRVTFALEGPLMTALAAGEAWLIASGQHQLLAGLLALPALVMCGVGWVMTWQAFCDWSWLDA